MKIYIDVSELSKVNYVSGIQRVVIEVVTRWIEWGYNPILIAFDEKKKKYCVIDNERFKNYYLMHLQKKNFFSKQYITVDEIKLGSVFLDIDSVWMNSLKRSYLLPLLKKQGVKIVSHIYDVIPITEPQYCHILTTLHFMDYIGAHIENSDLIIANANATIDAIRNIDSEGIGNYQTAVVKLGSDIRAKKTQLSISSDVKAAVESGKYILMVGTIEPRKNHKFVLDAFEKELFDKDLHLIFAGRPGWNIEEFMERIQNHPLRNNKFFYFNNATDDDITYLYENAFFTAFASYNEGFGLPIIESFAHGTPVLSADIPVLRETGGEYCEYFSLNDLDDFVSKVRKYDNEDLYKKICNQIAGYKATTWEECAKEIFSAVSQGI